MHYQPSLILHLTPSTVIGAFQASNLRKRKLKKLLVSEQNRSKAQLLLLMKTTSKKSLYFAIFYELILINK